VNSEKTVSTKLKLLELGEQLGNVAQACRMMGYSRDSYYRIKKLYETGGLEALAPVSRSKPNLKNRVAPEVERAVVELALENPTWGQARVSGELRTNGVDVSPSGVRRVWQRSGLTKTNERIAAREERLAAPKRNRTDSVRERRSDVHASRAPRMMADAPVTAQPMFA
jgi:transposase